MSERVRAVLEAADSLSETELELVIDQLSERLPGNSVDSMSDAALEAELDRRAAEFAKDPSVAIPWKDFKWDEPGE